MDVAIAIVAMFCDMYDFGNLCWVHRTVRRRMRGRGIAGETRRDLSARRLIDGHVTPLIGIFFALVSSLTKAYRLHCAKQDIQVKRQRPIAYVVVINLDATIIRCVIPTAHLPQTCDARRYTAIMAEDMAILFDL